MKIYKNIQGKIVTTQQFNQLEHYILETYNPQTGKIKEIQEKSNIFTHDEGQMFYSHFLEEEEDKESIIQSYLQKESIGIIYIYIDSAFGYTLYRVESYDKNGDYVNLSKEVLDPKNRRILNYDYNKVTEELLENSIPTKYYYDENFNDPYYGERELVLEFKYELDDQTGEIEMGVYDIWQEDFSVMDAAKIIEYFGQEFWDARKTYFENQEPLLPTTEII